tara:strand:- start:244 stop:510 length:267 start_codon:yes stop_codon:yes gene_type:complete
MNILKEERTLKIGKIYIKDDNEKELSRNLELSYQESFPTKLYLYFINDNPDHDSFSSTLDYEEVQKLKSWITSIHNIMKKENGNGITE